MRRISVSTFPPISIFRTAADSMGIELAAKAGYHPYAAVTLWQKMNKVGGGRVPEFLSTHPAPENREQTLKALVPQMMPYYEQSKWRNK